MNKQNGEALHIHALTDKKNSEGSGSVIPSYSLSATKNKTRFQSTNVINPQNSQRKKKEVS